MKFDYDTSAITRQYDTARFLPGDVMACWMDALAGSIGVDGVRTIVDLGCGTGRFCRPLATTFAARVFAVDPSEKMRAMARENLGAAEDIAILAGNAEAIPLVDAAADLVFMSMIYHYLPDIPQVMREIARVLAPGGYLAIRNAVRENLDTIPLFRFFPEARVIEEQRMPCRDSVMRAMAGGGFTAICRQSILQQFAESYWEYLRKVELRGLSVLHLITEEQFQAGLTRLRDYCQRHGDAPVYEEVELFIGRRSPDLQHL